MKTRTPHRESHTPAAYCTNCKKLVDGATAISDPKARPHKGDFTICIYCGHVMIFDKGLTLRDLTDVEMVEIAGNRDVIKIQTARKMLLDERGNRSIFDDVDGEESP